MIRFLLGQDDHGFDSWFRSAELMTACGRPAASSCPVCASSAQVEKALMAPAVAEAEARPLAEPQSNANARWPDSAAGSRKTRNVGMNAAEAHAIHEGEAPERTIYGEARAEEARRLIEDGIAGGALALHAPAATADPARGAHPGLVAAKPLPRVFPQPPAACSRPGLAPKTPAPVGTVPAWPGL